MSCATKPSFHAVSETSAPLDARPADLALLNRITWGTGTADAQVLARVSLPAYLDGQLDPPNDDGLPADARAEIAAMEISRKPVREIMMEMRALQQNAQKLRGQPGYDDAQKAYQQRMNDLAREAQTRFLLRALYSRNQLKEQLTWFWMNHFNVSQGKNDIRALIGDYEETAIRPHLLGKFRDLLAATVIHPAMLEYLDNFQNAVGHINENYAREIMELHTMGVGSGYTQKDVQELARILTGAGVNFTGKPTKVKPQFAPFYRRSGLFEFNPNRHDFGEKAFLNRRVAGSGFAEIEGAIAILSAEPATARHVSTQLAQFFCCDEPPASLVSAMAATFQSTDGDIAAVLRTLFAAPDFRTSLGHKFKDPAHYAISALRAAYGQQVILNAQPLINWLNRMGEPLYGRETPDGYPMTEVAWSGPGALETRFEIARAIGVGHTGLYKLATEPAAVQDPAPPPLIEQTRYFHAVAPTLSSATLGALDQGKSPADSNLLFLASPEFMHR
ncbi:MAG: DUF1800 domain-containing protein [Alphaproteobacteria bacterium]|nr:DUF1800 domain-containing protein [Reyranella sp.]MBL6852527.1 DUF1800 domain-containing protein [Alphaproteobacteria bacterium]MBL6940486.1 DUF1800 domain-containing protein [Alphaproteobacteria bacterium]